MFDFKKLLLKKVTLNKIKFSGFKAGMTTTLDESMLSPKYAKKLFNYTVKDGALKKGMGFSTVMLPDSEDVLNSEENPLPNTPNNLAIKNLWQFRRYLISMKHVHSNVIFQLEDGSLHFFLSVTIMPHIWSLNLNAPNEFTGNIVGVNYHLNGDDKLILFIPEQSRIIVIGTGDVGDVIEDAPNLVDIELHHERLFAIKEGDRRTLMFSANLDPTNWNVTLEEAGFIDFRDERGEILKLVSFNDYLYVFREFGVSRVSAYGSQEEFSVTHLYSSSSRIYADSVVASGDRILFFTNEGLFSFDGFSGNRIRLGIENLLKNEPNHFSKATFFEDKYYLALRMNFEDDLVIGCEAEEDFVNNALIEYDILTGDINILRGVDILNLLPLKEKVLSKLLAIFRGENSNKFGQLDYSGKFFDDELEGMWTSPKTDFGYPGKLKIIKEVFIKTEGDCQIVIESEKEKKTYKVKGKKTYQRVKTNVLGQEIEISFVSKNQDNVLITSPEVTFGVIGWWKKNF